MEEAINVWDVLKSFHAWRRRSVTQGFSHCLHDLSSSLHVSDYCLREIKNGQGKRDVSVYVGKLEKSLNKTQTLLNQTREEIRRRREGPGVDLQGWSNFLNELCAPLSPEGKPIKKIEFAFQSEEEEELYESPFFPLHMAGLYQLAKKLGTELSGFSSTFFIGERGGPRELKLRRIPQVWESEAFQSLSFRMDLQGQADEWKKFYQEFFTKSARINEKIKTLCSSESYEWGIQEWELNKQEEIQGTFFLARSRE